MHGGKISVPKPICQLFNSSFCPRSTCSRRRDISSDPLEARKRLEANLSALARPFAEGARALEELSARHEVEADAQDVEEYVAIMTEAWRRGLESA